MIGEASALLFEVFFVPIGKPDFKTDRSVKIQDPGTVPNIFSIRSRLTDVTFLLQHVTEERDKYKKVADNLTKENEILKRLSKSTEKNESVLERRLASALERNDRMRLQLRHADEVSVWDEPVSPPRRMQ